MKLLNIYSLGLGVLLLGLVPNSAMGVTIDLFQDVSSDPGFNAGIQDISLTWDGNSTTQSDTSSVSSLEGVQWGKRTMDLSIQSSNSTVSKLLSHNGTLQVVSDGTNGIVDLATSSTIVASGGITWDGWDGNNLNLIDLKANDHNAFNLKVIEIDQGFTLKFNVTDKDGNVATISKNISNSISEESVIFEYQEASNYDAVNFNQVQQVGLEIDNPSNSAGVDFTFDFLETTEYEVPFEFSPSLGIILCGGLFGIHKLRKRLQSN